MVTESPSESRWPGTARNLTIAMAARIVTAKVAKMAIPPPRGTAVWWYLSSEGCARKPVRRASFLTMAVKRAERTNEPKVRMTAKMVNVRMASAPSI